MCNVITLVLHLKIQKDICRYVIQTLLLLTATTAFSNKKSRSKFVLNF